MPKVSIIIATHNNERTLGKAIRSAQNQTVRDIEIIVVNDASIDGTSDLMAALAAHDTRIKCVDLQQNAGAGAARNVALSMATGEWITILDGDDWYDATRLEVLLKAGYDYEADLVADNVKIVDHVGQCVIYKTNYGKKDRLLALSAKSFFDGDNPLHRYPIGYIQPLIRRKFLVDHKIVYDTTHRVGEDFIFVSEILLQGARAFIVPGAYYNYIISISPITREKSPNSHSSIPSSLSFLTSLIRGCDELLQKYSETMSSEVLHAVLRRRQLIESTLMFKKMREALREQHFIKAARILITQPVILILIVQNTRKLLEANLWARLYALNARYRKEGKLEARKAFETTRGAWE